MQLGAPLLDHPDDPVLNMVVVAPPRIYLHRMFAARQWAPMGGGKQGTICSWESLSIESLPLAVSRVGERSPGGATGGSTAAMNDMVAYLERSAVGVEQAKERDAAWCLLWADGQLAERIPGMMFTTIGRDAATDGMLWHCLDTPSCPNWVKDLFRRS